ncbi:hypothetical protein SLS62_005651 [Diatrype stigma]|uniref:Uncharacterized protein n=1 Tax=Diatrype stigma TaxID=117547 RepID=A0AAN9YSJ1_9PEZI
MGKTGIRTVGKVSFDTPASEQKVLHNRWHPDIPFAGTIKDGETVKIECLDWTGGQIGNNDSADDIRNVDLTQIHYLTGPFEIEGAQPGDLLLVEIMDVQPFEDQPWGFTGIFHPDNGGGFLDEIYPSAAKAIWDFEGIYCTSRHIPHVKFAGLIHPGILGCAPSAEVLATWNQREGDLIAANKLERKVALPPEPTSARTLIAFYLSETCYHDPSSVFWRPEKARQLSYSAIRKEQARIFADEAAKREPTKWDRVTAPQLCIGIGSVSRHGLSYLRETLGSILEGLDDLERRNIYIVVFLAHSNQSQHEDSGAAWLRSMADSLPAYPDDREMLEVIERLEENGDYVSHARKQKIDYSVLLAECAKVNPNYVMTLEDDVIALDGWFHRTLSALRTAGRKTREMGKDHCNLLVLGELALIITFRWHSLVIRRYISPIYIILICGVFTPMTIGLFFAAGRSCMFPKQPGVSLMQKYGCCGQGLVFPLQQVVEDLLPLYSTTTDSHAAVDTFLEDYANANNELRWAVTPVLIQHVGGKSSHGVGDQLHGHFTDDMPFEYNFEMNDPVQLMHEHLAWVEELAGNT